MGITPLAFNIIVEATVPEICVLASMRRRLLVYDEGKAGIHPCWILRNSTKAACSCFCTLLVCVCVCVCVNSFRDGDTALRATSDSQQDLCTPQADLGSVWAWFLAVCMITSPFYTLGPCLLGGTKMSEANERVKVILI